MGLQKTGLEVNGSGSELCHMAEFGINGITTVLIWLEKRNRNSFLEICPHSITSLCMQNRRNSLYDSWKRLVCYLDSIVKQVEKSLSSSSVVIHLLRHVKT
jgi:hypothetical protein